MKYFSLTIIICLTVQLFLSGCGTDFDKINKNDSYSYSDINPLPEITSAGNILESIDSEAFFSAGDKEIGYSESDDIHIHLNEDQIFCNSSNVEIDGTSAVITCGGNYIISGKLENGRIIIKVNDDENVRLILNGVEIINDSGSPINIEQANKVRITLAEDTENILNSGSLDSGHTADAIYANSCITINGLGSLKAMSKTGNGIFSASDIFITGGDIRIDAGNCGLIGAKSVRISNTNMQINAKENGICSLKNDDDLYGFVYISDGSFDINCYSSGICAGSSLIIEGGFYDITVKAFMENYSEELWETKRCEAAFMAEKDISITEGSFCIFSSYNALNAGESVSISGGSFDINTENRGINAASAVFIDKTNISIEKCFQGICSKKILVQGGYLNIESNDDGLNAGGGIDQSGTNKGSKEECFVEISGGCITINSSGDSIDSIGGILVSDGLLVAVSSNAEGNLVFDCGSNLIINGGTVMGAGTFSDNKEYVDIKQPFVVADIDSMEPGDSFELQDISGHVIIKETIQENVSSIFITSSALKTGESYKLISGNNNILVSA